MFTKLIEWRLCRSQMGVQIFRLGIDIKQARYDLPFCCMLLQKRQSTGSVPRIIIRVDFAEC